MRGSDEVLGGNIYAGGFEDLCQLWQRKLVAEGDGLDPAIRSAFDEVAGHAQAAAIGAGNSRQVVDIGARCPASGGYVGQFVVRDGAILRFDLIFIQDITSINALYQYKEVKAAISEI